MKTPPPAQGDWRRVRQSGLARSQRAGDVDAERCGNRLRGGIGGGLAGHRAATARTILECRRDPTARPFLNMAMSPPGHRGSVLAPSPPEPYTSWPSGARDGYRQHGGVQSFFRHRLRSAGVSTRAQINVPNVGPSAHLLAPSCPSGRHRLWIGYGSVERGVPLVVALEQRRDVLAFEDTAKWTISRTPRQPFSGHERRCGHRREGCMGPSR